MSFIASLSWLLQQSLNCPYMLPQIISIYKITTRLIKSKINWYDFVWHSGTSEDAGQAASNIIHLPNWATSLSFHRQHQHNIKYYQLLSKYRQILSNYHQIFSISPLTGPLTSLSFHRLHQHNWPGQTRSWLFINIQCLRGSLTRMTSYQTTWTVGHLDSHLPPGRTRFCWSPIVIAESWRSCVKNINRLSPWIWWRIESWVVSGILIIITIRCCIQYALATMADNDSNNEIGDNDTILLAMRGWWCNPEDFLFGFLSPLLNQPSPYSTNQTHCRKYLNCSSRNIHVVNVGPFFKKRVKGRVFKFKMKACKFPPPPLV